MVTEFKDDDFPDLMEYTRYINKLMDVKDELTFTIFKMVINGYESKNKALLESNNALQRKVDKLTNRLIQVEKAIDFEDDGK